MTLRQVVYGFVPSNRSLRPGEAEVFEAVVVERPMIFRTIMFSTEGVENLEIHSLTAGNTILIDAPMPALVFALEKKVERDARLDLVSRNVRTLETGRYRCDLCSAEASGMYEIDHGESCPLCSPEVPDLFLRQHMTPGESVRLKIVNASADGTVAPVRLAAFFYAEYDS
jgi:hypothetical protein